MKPIRHLQRQSEAFALKLITLAVVSVFAQRVSAQALPTGGIVTAGSATISSSGGAMTINQTTPRALINWGTFNIGAGGSVTFAQPAANSIAVNRASTGGQSAINGSLTANGNVMILNPNGVLFGTTAIVNVAGLVASTGNISGVLDPNSTTAPLAITGATTGSVTNQGSITVTGAGLAAFVAPSVVNSGTITASSGRIVLAGAQAATISLNGDLYEMAINQPVAGGTVTNTGTLQATGGSILLSAEDASRLVSGVINLSGIQQANRIEVNGNKVVLASALDAATVTGDSNAIEVQGGARIQDAVNTARSGGTVSVGAGTYAEQLTIAKSLTIAGAGADQTIIAPTSLAPVIYNSTDGPIAMRNILTIGGSSANSVEVSGVTFRGPVADINAGIFVRDGAHAYIHDNKLIDIRESAALSGNQRGVGILVGRAYLSTSGTATIENNVITGYQKGGIVVDGPGSQATITGNTVTGEGPTGVIAQNGIQASRGASATIAGNTVSRNNYTGDDEAAGILVFTPGANLNQGAIAVGPNAVTDNEVGIWTNDPRTLATINLTGTSGNARNAVASFEGGYTGSGTLLEYPAWSASTSALVGASSFSGTQAGDIVDAGGALRVSGWSGFAAIQPAINAVAAGGTVNVAAGTYTQTSTLNVKKGVTLAGAGEGLTTIDARGVTAGTGGYGISVSADDVTLRDFTVYGPSAFFASAYGIKVSPGGTASSRLRNFTIQDVTSRGAGKAELDLNGVDGAMINRVTADGAPVGNDSGTTQGAGVQLTDSANVTVTNSTTRNNAWGGIAIFQANRSYNQQTSNITIAANNNLTESTPLYLQDESSMWDFGALNMPGFGYAVRNAATMDSAQYTWMQATQQNAVDFAVNLPTPSASYVQGWSGTALTQNFYVGTGNVLGGGTAPMSIGAAAGASGSGADIRVAAGTYPERVTLTSPRNLSFGGSTVHSLTIDSGASGSGIGGSATSDTAAGFVFNAPVVLRGDTVLDTSAVAGAVTAGAINGTSAGAQALTIHAGAGAVSLGDLGATTRLGATDVAGDISFNGSSYSANSLSFTGPVTLNQPTVTLSTNGGGIAVNGDIRNAGSTRHALAIRAGTDGARGDVSLVSGGTRDNPLGAFDVAAENFALTGTLWVAGYRIDGRGAVALSSHTLQATDATATSFINAGGAVTGSTVSSGSVQVVSGEDVAANVTAQGAASVSANNVSGAISGADVTVAAQNVANATVSAQGAASVTATNVSGAIAGNSVTVAAQNGVNAIISARTTATVSGATVSGSFSGTDVKIAAQDVVQTSVTAVRAATIEAADTVQATVQAQAAVISAGSTANVSGSSRVLVVDAPSGSVSGSFGAVANVGGGLIDVNGKPVVDTPLPTSVVVSRVVPVGTVIVGSTAAGGEDATQAPISAQIAPSAVPVSRSTPVRAGDFILQGQSVEIDLSPGREEEQR